MLFAREAECPLVRSTTYYVDQVNGVDGNAGTIGAPWKTWAKVRDFIAGWASVAGGIRIRLKRGCVWNEDVTVTVAPTKPHVTLDYYGNDYDPRPLVSKYGVTLDNGWSQTGSGASPHVYERTEATDVACVREGVRERVYTRCASIAEVEATIGSFYWVGGATNKLYIHPYNNLSNTLPNFDARGYRAVYSNTTPGLLIQADDVRVQGIVVEGHGCNRATPHNAQWGITASTTGTDACLIVDCESYHNATHCMGHSSTGGGISTWIGCRMGLFGMDVNQGGTAFAGYTDTGGHEVNMFWTEYAYGGIPSTTANFSGVPMLSPIGTGYVFHTGASGVVAHCLMVGNVFRQGNFQCTNAGTNNNPVVWTDLKDCRSWCDGERFYARLWNSADAARTVPAMINGSDPAGTYSAKFNTYSESQVLCYGGGGQIAFFTGVGAGVHWNNKLILRFDGDPSFNGSQFNYYGYTSTAAGNALDFTFCQLHYTANTRLVPGYCIDSTANGVYPTATFKNCIISGDGNGDNANNPTYIRMGGKNHVAYVVDNFYSGLDASRRASGDGYSADALAVEGTSSVVQCTPPRPGSPLITTTPQTVRGYRLEYDMNWNARNAATARGPQEVVSSPGLVFESTGIFQRAA